MKSKGKIKRIILIIAISLVAIALMLFIAIKLYINSQIKSVTNGHLYKIGSSIENLLNNGGSFHFNITNTQNSSGGLDLVICEGDIKLDVENKNISMIAKYSEISSTKTVNQNYVIVDSQFIILDNKNNYINSYDISNYQDTLFLMLNDFKGSSDIKTVEQAQNIISVDWKSIFNSLAGSSTDYFVAYDKFGECINTLFLNYNNADYLKDNYIDFKQVYTDDTTKYTFVLSLANTITDILETINPSIGALTSIIPMDSIYKSLDKIDFININVSTKNKYLNSFTTEYKLGDKNIITSLSISSIGSVNIKEDELKSAYQLYLDNK